MVRVYLLTNYGAYDSYTNLHNSLSYTYVCDSRKMWVTHTDLPLFLLFRNKGWPNEIHKRIGYKVRSFSVFYFKSVNPKNKTFVRVCDREFSKERTIILLLDNSSVTVMDDASCYVTKFGTCVTVQYAKGKLN